MDQCHDCCVLMLQPVCVSVAQCEVILDDSVTTNFSIAKQAKKWCIRKHLTKGICLHIALVIVVTLASPQTGKHETNGVPFWNFCCLKPSNCDFG